MDEVFKAINDPSRRLLLDKLLESDGQTLGELCAHLDGMTRYGVMNHLKVLEAAELVITRKQGRSKLHFLNPVPIRGIHDRWITKYAEHSVAMIANLKKQFEPQSNKGEIAMTTPDHIYSAYINGSAEAVWEALTNPDKTQQFFYGTRVKSDWLPGSPMEYFNPDGTLVSTGEVISADAPKRLECLFHAQWDEELAAEGPVREVWLLDEVNGMTQLTIELYDSPPTSKTYQDFVTGFPYIVSGLKSLIETGKGLPAPH